MIEKKKKTNKQKKKKLENFQSCPKAKITNCSSINKKKRKLKGKNKRQRNNVH